MQFSRHEPGFHQGVLSEGMTSMSE